jgi:hypothetical protein
MEQGIAVVIARNKPHSHLCKKRERQKHSIFQLRKELHSTQLQLADQATIGLHGCAERESIHPPIRNA